jgi:hypothetical protein
VTNTPNTQSVAQIVKKALAGLGLNDSTLPAVLSHIDEVCSEAASKIGNDLSQHPDWKGLGWFFGQYRGTILSGRRSFGHFYFRHDLGTEKENRGLLGIYWNAYSLGSTIGELFEQRCLALESNSSEGETTANVGPPYWNILCVYPSRKLKFTQQAIQNNDDYAIHRLEIPVDWQEGLITNDIRTLISGLIQLSLPEDQEKIREILQADPDFIKLCQLLKSRRNLLLAEVIWNDSVTDTEYLAHMRDFAGTGIITVAGQLKTADELVVSRVLASIQMLCMYWKWTQLKQFLPGPLCVCIPKPGKKNTGRLQPRFGFAVLFAGDSRAIEPALVGSPRTMNSEVSSNSPIKRDTQGVANEGEMGVAAFYGATRLSHSDEAVEKVKELLPSWDTALNGASSRILMAGGANIEAKVRQQGFALLGEDVTAKLIDKLSRLHLGGKAAALLLLERLFPLLSEIDRNAPGFVHEGHRFAASILLGHKYHEQVLGESLGSVKVFLQELKVRVPLGCIDNPTFMARTDPMLFKTLVKSCYSLFDWDGVVLFGILSPDGNKGMEFSSFLRLSDLPHNIPPTELYRSLTLRHSGLFAVSVDRAGIIRVYYAGTFLLYKEKGVWKLGSELDALNEELASGLRKIGNELRLPLSTDFLRSFVKLLLRISEEPGKGAMFVIANKQAHVKRLSSIAPPPKEIWQNLRPFDRNLRATEEEMETLYRLAIMDGATVVVLGEGTTLDEKWCKARIHPRRLVTEAFDLDKFWKVLEQGKWGDWTNILSYGAKHNAGFALAMRSANPKLKSLLVITVSADGPVTFMVGGEDPITKWPKD